MADTPQLEPDDPRVNHELHLLVIAALEEQTKLEPPFDPLNHDRKARVDRMRAVRNQVISGYLAKKSIGQT
jgi:hypothetical protein